VTRRSLFATFAGLLTASFSKPKSAVPPLPKLYRVFPVGFPMQFCVEYEMPNCPR
jgi:hypothetical protein